MQHLVGHGGVHYVHQSGLGEGEKFFRLPEVVDGEEEELPEA
jgi:hypothetical protein